MVSREEKLGMYAIVLIPVNELHGFLNVLQTDTAQKAGRRLKALSPAARALVDRCVEKRLIKELLRQAEL